MMEYRLTFKSDTIKRFLANWCPNTFADFMMKRTDYWVDQFLKEHEDDFRDFIMCGEAYDR